MYSDILLIFSSHTFSAMNHSSVSSHHTLTTHPHNHNHDGGGGSGSEGDTSLSSIVSSDSDNIGLKIVQALERMEDNLHQVLDRLDSIEKEVKTVTRVCLILILS